MDFTVLASSSRGNAYHVAAGDSSALLLECGIRWRDIQRRLQHKTRSIVACLLSHEHQDHAFAVADVMRAGIDVFATAGTWEALGIKHHRAQVVRAREQVRVGSWTVLPFDTVHDAAEPVGFVIANGDAKALYLTDTAYCRYTFKGLTHLFVEANHSLAILKRNVERGVVPEAYRRRVIRNHLPIERLLDMLRANDLSRVQEIHLLHLSDGNSDERAFKRVVAAVTGKPVYVAANGGA